MSKSVDQCGCFSKYVLTTCCTMTSRTPVRQRAFSRAWFAFLEKSVGKRIFEKPPIAFQYGWDCSVICITTSHASVKKFRMLASKRFLDAAIPADREVGLQCRRNLLRPEFAPFCNRAVGSHQSGLVVLPINRVQRFLTKHALLVLIPLRQDASDLAPVRSSLNLAHAFLGTCRLFGPARTTSQAEFSAVPNCCPGGMKRVDDNRGRLICFRTLHN